MICDVCAGAAGVADDYRRAAGRRPASWLGIRLRRANALHKKCLAPATCTCQHKACVNGNDGDDNGKA